MKVGFVTKLLYPFYSVLCRSPFFGERIRLGVNRRMLLRLFHNEILLLKGNHSNTNNRQSVLYFTANKCASVYVWSILKELAKEVGMTPIDFSGYAFNFGNWNELVLEGKIRKEVFKKEAYFYGPLRLFNRASMLDIEDYRVILMLRDPRDVLVSNYFSVAYSHAIPYQNKGTARSLLAAREKALAQTIDEHVLTEAPSLSDRYREYCEQLLNKSNVLFVKYEDMIDDFETWLGTILNFLEIDERSEAISRITREANFSVQEDVSSHKRQATPGDHKRKLKSETVESLNLRFQTILAVLGYSA